MNYHDFGNGGWGLPQVVINNVQEVLGRGEKTSVWLGSQGASKAIVVELGVGTLEEEVVNGFKFFLVVWT